MHVRFIGHFICLHFPLPVYCASFRVRRNAFHFSYRCVCVFFVAFLQSCSQKKTWNLCVVASIEQSLQEFHTAHPLHQLHNKNNNYNKNKTNQQQQNYLCVVVRRKLCPVKMRLSDRYKSSSSSSASSASASTPAIASYQSLSTHIEVIAAAGRLAGVNV